MIKCKDCGGTAPVLIDDDGNGGFWQCPGCSTWGHLYARPSNFEVIGGSTIATSAGVVIAESRHIDISEGLSS